MNKITTFIASQNGVEFVVAWANGKTTQGKLIVTVPASYSHQAVAAELCALHHLLVVRLIYGPDRAGNNLAITTSSREIKKLAVSDSQDSALSAYAGFLAARFSDAEYLASPKADWLKPRADNNVEHISLDGPLDDTVTIRGIGPVALTRHVVEQYRARSNWPEPYQAWQSVSLLMRGELFDVPVSEIAAEMYQEKHGVVGRLLWGRISKWMLVLAQRPGEPLRAVTAYYVERKPRGAVPLIPF